MTTVARDLEIVPPGTISEPERVVRPAPCEYPRSFSYITGEYSIRVGYADLAAVVDEVLDLWARVEAEGTTDVIDDGFEDLVAHIARLREWTGWGGVPGKYLTDAKAAP